MSNVPQNLKYATTHEWAQLEKENIVRVGITDFAQQELGDLVFVDLPKVGRRVKAQDQCAVVESVKTASDLYSPVSGEIAAVNDALTDKPELINDEPYNAWIFCVKADDLSALDALMDADGYRKMIEE
ncbi:MAG: glycine cleavage system protein GcvH [Gammaproteobacteria bacterium]